MFQMMKMRFDGNLTIESLIKADPWIVFIAMSIEQWIIFISVESIFRYDPLADFHITARLAGRF